MRYRYTAVIISSFAFFVGINLHSGNKKKQLFIRSRVRLTQRRLVLIQCLRQPVVSS